MTLTATATDSGHVLHPDHTRVVTRLFVPGREDVGPGESRATPVLLRVLELSEAAVGVAMREVDERFGTRHRDLHRTLRTHAEAVTDRIVDTADALSEARLLLLGAVFTHEFAIEGAALCNPSAVLFPHPTDDDDGDATFVMSVRGVGEGHRSSIGFRTGTITADGSVTVDVAAPFPEIGEGRPADNHRSVFHAKLAEIDDDGENTAFVLGTLPDRFDDAQLYQRLVDLALEIATRRNTAATIDSMRAVASSSYRVEFAEPTAVSERVLWPYSPAERQGMEDARFVHFTADDGSSTYYGTYTAFDGANIAQHLIRTDDFRHFEMSPMAGAAAVGKGLALFPRKVHGRYAALSRSDRESNAIAFSDDIHCWPTSELLQSPARPWEMLQLGNCGSPIETEAGWLMLTHGVGAMRTYSIGVLLLDIDDPSRVLATSVEPIIVPTATRRDGYVPNVVYSCGGFTRGDVLVLPYGIADQAIAIATLSVRELIDSLTPVE